MNTKELLEFLTLHWYQPAGMKVALICSWIFLLPLAISADLPILAVTAITLIATIAIITIWLIGQKWPRNKKNKIGFVIAITCTELGEKNRIEEDFIAPLRNLILSGKTGKYFHLIILPPHLARKIVTTDDAVRARARMRAHFMIHGRVRLRELNGKQHHMLELNGNVAHLEVPEDVGKEFTAEFSSFLPRKLNIPVDNDAIVLEFTSNWADIVARYIIGVAAAFSGDLAYAEDLLKSVENKLPGMDQSFPVYRQLRDLVPKRISSIHLALATMHHRAWVNDFDDKNISLVKIYIDKIDPKYKTRPALMLTAISEFWINRDLSKSTNIVQSLLKKDSLDPVLHYNLGFLYGYSGNMKTSIRHYRVACAYGVDADILYQIEEFINKVLDNEPDKFQLHLCLGFFNKEAKGDYLIAKRHFENFLTTCKEDQLIKEQELAKSWILEMNKEISET